jgi:hypothetical protein
VCTLGKIVVKKVPTRDIKVLTNEEKYARLPTANNDDKLLDKNSDENKTTPK